MSMKYVKQKGLLVRFPSMVSYPVRQNAIMTPPVNDEEREIFMAVSVGVMRDGDAWNSCMLEDGQVLESFAFESTASALAYVERVCVDYPELSLAIALESETPFLALSAISDQQLESLSLGTYDALDAQQAREFLIALRNINLHSFLMPSIKYLPGVPVYRKLLRATLGTSNDVCAVAALLYRLREKEATWPEMHFLCVGVGDQRRSIQVVEEGQIVNGIAATMQLVPQKELQSLFEQALWEGLMQDMAGLMAIHHIEDIVVLGEYQDALSEHFADKYQVYMFPTGEADMPGREAALGAAIIAEGLYLSGLASEVVERLHIREAIA